MYSASSIAYYFVKKGIKSDNFITQMRLQRIIYLAHGLHLAINNKPLIRHNIKAGKFGPQIDLLSHEYRYFGSRPIADRSLISFLHEKEKLPKHIKIFLNDIWNIFGFNISITDIMCWLSKTSSPWHIYNKKSEDSIIPNEDIREFFLKEFGSLIKV